MGTIVAMVLAVALKTFVRRRPAAPAENDTAATSVIERATVGAVA
jgi:hypothetical protein